MFRQFVLSTVIGLSLTASAGAGEIVDLAAKAETALQEGKGVEAITTMRQALIASWNAAPMAIGKALFVSEEAAGWGNYVQRPDNTFAQGEPILMYFEPVGFVWQPDGQLYTSSLVADFVIRSPEGDVLAGKKNFGEFNFRGNEQNSEVMVNMTLTLTGAPVGSYVLAVELRDSLGGQSAEVEMPFNIK